MDAKDHADTIEEVKGRNGRVALLIAALAAFLSIVEVSGGNAEQGALKSNIDASNLWAFFQAKTIRRANLQAMSDALELQRATVGPQHEPAFAKQIATWKQTIERLETEPETREGRKELLVRAQAAEKERDLSLAQADQFDRSSAALQLAIVLASASIVISVPWLSWVAGVLGVVGLAFGFLGWFAPTLI